MAVDDFFVVLDLVDARPPLPWPVEPVPLAPNRPGTSGLVDVTLVNSFATSLTSSADHFKYERPSITGVSPASGLKAGGTLVTMTGSGFARGEGISAFRFRKTPATAVECVSTTECVMLAPAAATAGTVDVRAVTSGKTSVRVPADQYTYD